MREICTLEVHDSIFKLIFHNVQSRIGSNFNQSIMDLSFIDFVKDLTCLHAAKASKFLVVATKLFSMWSCISNVEDVS